ncbi:MAG: SpoIIE family protein phosphatase [Crocinitomicaceae bacterium]|nr:SpoIIE family protein phosphatase [Crocinitomicaceae bacterium]
MKINAKLTIAFFLIAFSSITIIGFLSYFKGKKSLEEESFNRLTAVREMKSTQIEDYFSQIANQIVTFSEDHTIIEAMELFKIGFDTIVEELKYDESEIQSMDFRLTKYYESEFIPRLKRNLDTDPEASKYIPQKLNEKILQDLYIASNENEVGNKHYLHHASDSSTYSKAHKIYHPLIRSYLEKFEYYDIFLVDDETGHIVYSVFKEVDFGTSLIDGPYANTNLAEAFKLSRDADHKDFVKLVDFKSYHPSYNAPAAFISSPIFNDNGEKLGVLIFQMPINRINEIMTNRHEWANVGLGESGETYIVAEDFTLRNQSRFFIEDKENYFKMIEEIGTPESTITKIKNFESTIGLQEVKTEGTIAALEGKTDARIFNDYRGVPVLSSYKPLKIQDMHWVIMSEIDRDEAFEHVYDLRKNMIIVFVGLFITIVFASIIISKKITKPIKQLTSKAQELAGGNLDVHIDIYGKDEIGSLSQSFSDMQHSIKKMVDELNDINHNLEQKVADRTQEIQHQKEMVEEKNREIVDSINYALRLQSAIIPPESKIREKFNDSFVLFKPKDIVSGDFYWMDSKGNNVILAVADCTGHGVPGAMVSVVGANSLNRCVKEFGLRKPSSILDKLRELIIETFEMANHEVKDGMDISLISIDREKGKVQWAGAHNPLWILKKNSNEIIELKADKQPIGKFEFAKPFNNHEIDFETGDCLYMFSDGFADQFGGDKGKKLKASTMREIFISCRNLPMQEQKIKIIDAFEAWKNMLEQVDDVCVMGVRF